MADVAAAPSTAPTAAAAPAAPAQVPVGEAILRQLPEKLQNLTRPVVVSGTVAGETPEGLTRIRTAAGEVLLKSPVPLPADKPVTLQIPAGSPPPKANLLAQLPTAPPPAPPPTTAPITNPTTPAAGPTTSPVTAQTLLQSAVTTAVAGATPQPAQILTTGSLISAVVLATNPRPTAPAAGPAIANPPTAGAPAPGGKAVPPTGDGAAKTDGAPTTESPGGSGGAAPLSGGSRGGAQGQPVELGGDAAHRGGMLAPPPATPQPTGGQPEQPTTDQQTTDQQAANRQPAPEQSGQKPASQNRAAPPNSGQNTTPNPAAPTPANAKPPIDDALAPPPTGKAGAASPDVPLSTTAPMTAPPPATPTRGPAVGLTMTDFATGKPPPTTQTPATATPSAEPAAAASASAPTPPMPAPSAPNPAPPLRPGQTLAFRVASFTPPGGDAPSVPPTTGDNDGPPLLEGTVAGTTPQGKPIVALRDGMVALNTDLKLAPGARLTLQWTDPAAVGQNLAAPTAEETADYLQTRDWPAMKQALSALRDIDPALVHNLLASAMPQPNRKLGAALTFLISAMRGGDARGWLGNDAVDALRDNGKESLLRGLEREFRAKEEQAAEQLPDDWRGVTLPMYDQTGLNPLHLHVRPFPEPEGEAAKKGGGKKGSRFLLDVELSKLGPLQLDGMVKPPRFDLILRSKTPLDPQLRQELREIFAGCLEAVGYSGGVSFQSDMRAWVKLARAGSLNPTVTA